MNKNEQLGHLAKVWSKKQARSQPKLPHTVRQQQDVMLSVPFILATLPCKRAPADRWNLPQDHCSQSNETQSSMMSDLIQ